MRLRAELKTLRMISGDVVGSAFYRIYKLKGGIEKFALFNVWRAILPIEKASEIIQTRDRLAFATTQQTASGSKSNAYRFDMYNLSISAKLYVRERYTQPYFCFHCMR